jgi:hypothetical protein
VRTRPDSSACGDARGVGNVSGVLRVTAHSPTCPGVSIFNVVIRTCLI